MSADLIACAWLRHALISDHVEMPSMGGEPDPAGLPPNANLETSHHNPRFRRRWAGGSQNRGARATRPQTLSVHYVPSACLLTSLHVHGYDMPFSVHVEIPAWEGSLTPQDSPLPQPRLPSRARSHHALKTPFKTGMSQTSCTPPFSPPPRAPSPAELLTRYGLCGHPSGDEGGGRRPAS